MSPKRLTQSAAIGLSLIAIATPAAAGAQDLRSPDARDSAPLVRAGQDLRSPDARSAVMPQTGSVVPQTGSVGADLRTPDSRDAGEGRGTFNAPDVMVVKLREPAPVAVSDGMDWGDAGIGAGVLLALAALALAGTFAVTHRRGPATTV